MSIESAKTQLSDATDAPAKRARPLRLRVNSALRWLHIYISMFSLLLILFFALTGITLNHPEWNFGPAARHQEIKGTMPANWKTGANVNWLVVVEHLRARNGVRGRADEPRLESGEGSISFVAPGYTADCFINEKTGAYELTVDTSGPLALMNDLHRGQDAGPIWARAIDVSGIFLTLVSLTGIGLLLYLKKVRRSAIIIIVVGAIVAVILMKLAR